MKQLTESERAALTEVAQAVGTSPESLYRLIAFESGWDPQAKNPRSSARGLIQFIDDTSVWLGYASSAHLIEQCPTIEAQLRGPVQAYLLRYGPYDTEYKLFMAVFYPAARTWDPDREFPASVQAANPGVKTPRDYMTAVYRSGDYSAAAVASAVNGFTVFGLLSVAAFGAIVIWYLRS